MIECGLSIEQNGASEIFDIPNYPISWLNAEYRKTFLTCQSPVCIPSTDIIIEFRLFFEQSRYIGLHTNIPVSNLTMDRKRLMRNDSATKSIYFQPNYNCANIMGNIHRLLYQFGEPRTIR